MEEKSWGEKPGGIQVQPGEHEEEKGSIARAEEQEKPSGDCFDEEVQNCSDERSRTETGQTIQD